MTATYAKEKAFVISGLISLHNSQTVWKRCLRRRRRYPSASMFSGGFLSRGIRFVKDLSNAMTLDNVLEFDQLRRSSVAFQAWSAAISFGSPTMLRTRRRL
jgi:hypothetical protein